MRILLLTHKDLVPPQSPKPSKNPQAEWKAEQDVLEALTRLGHEGATVGLLDELDVIGQAIAVHSPHIAFNLMEEFDGVAQFDQNVVSYLELMRVRYTGCNPRGLMLARDKALAKKVLAYHGISTPRFAVFPRGGVPRRPKELEFPLIVKCLTEEASLGIAQSSVVHDDERLADRVRFIHESLGTDAIAEGYVEGRELYVGMLGNRRIDLLPIWELSFPQGTEHGPRIATRRVKWDPKYRQKYGIESAKANELCEETEERIRRVCREAYRALGLNGYARMDLRLSASGQVHFIEANPNPHIGHGEDFAASAETAGIPYDTLLDRILSLGLRWSPS